MELVLLDTTVQFLWSYPTLPPCSVSSPPCSFSGMWEVTPLKYSFAVSITTQSFKSLIFQDISPGSGMLGPKMRNLDSEQTYCTVKVPFLMRLA